MILKQEQCNLSFKELQNRHRNSQTVDRVVRLCNNPPHLQVLLPAQASLAALVTLVQQRRMESSAEGHSLSAEAAAFEIWGDDGVMSSPEWPSLERLRIDHTTGARALVAHQDKAAFEATNADPSLSDDMTKPKRPVECSQL